MFAPIPQRALEHVAEIFFSYARQRQDILLRRNAGLPRSTWTQNPILKEWSFCNVFREDDRVTQWFKANIREPLRGDPKVFFATVAFRWFNRINAGEVIRDLILAEKDTNGWDMDKWYHALEAVRRRDGRIVTGAYMIKTPARMDKISGILVNLAEVWRREEEFIYTLTTPDLTLEAMWERVCTIPYMGGFTSYEVVTDLRHTRFLENASDIMTWTNPGPGCAAGLGELFCSDEKAYNRHKSSDREFMIYLMQQLLACSQQERYWPQDWPKWEMRDVEHTSCEVMKYLRALTGQRLKRRYKGTADVAVV